MTIKGLLSRAEASQAKSEQCMQVTTIALVSVCAISFLAYSVLTHATHPPSLCNMSAHKACFTYALGGGLVSAYIVGLVAYWCASIRRKKDREYLQEVAKKLPASEQEDALRQLKDLHGGFHADLTQEINKKGSVMRIEKLSAYPKFGKQGNQVRELGITTSAFVGIMALAAFAYFVLPYYAPHLHPFLHQSQQATRLIYTVGAGAALSTLIALTTRCYYRVKNRQLDRNFPQELAKAMSTEKEEDNDEKYLSLLSTLRVSCPKFYGELLNEIHDLKENKRNALEILYMMIEPDMFDELSHPVFQDPALLAILVEDMAEEEDGRDTEFYAQLLKFLGNEHPKLYVGLIKKIESRRAGQEAAMKVLCLALEQYLIVGLNIPGLSQGFINTFEGVRKNTNIQVDGKSINAQAHFEALCA